MSAQLQLDCHHERSEGSAVSLPAAFSDIEERIERALRSLLLEPRAKDVLTVLCAHRGALQAIKSSAIAELLGLPAGEAARRSIAGNIETLVEIHHIPIGGLRVPPYGYFLIETQRDLDLAIHARWGEIYSHMRYLRALTSKSDVAKLFGQKMLQLDAEESDQGRAA